MLRWAPARYDRRTMSSVTKVRVFVGCKADCGESIVVVRLSTGCHGLVQLLQAGSVSNKYFSIRSSVAATAGHVQREIPSLYSTSGCLFHRTASNQDMVVASSGQSYRAPSSPHTNDACRSRLLHPPTRLTVSFTRDYLHEAVGLMSSAFSETDEVSHIKPMHHVLTAAR